MVTGDRDLFQLVDDERGITILYTARGIGRLQVIDEAAVTERYQIPGRGYAAFAALRGDPSDGLPGVPGVGEKTAAALVRVFGSVDGMLAAIDAGHGGWPGGSRAKLVAARTYLEAAVPVVQVAPDAPVPEVDGTLPAQAARPGRARRPGRALGPVQLTRPHDVRPVRPPRLTPIAPARQLHDDGSESAETADSLPRSCRQAVRRRRRCQAVRLG